MKENKTVHVYTHRANNVIALNGLRNELNKPCSFAFVRFAHKRIKKEPSGTTKFYKQNEINIEKIRILRASSIISDGLSKHFPF